MPVGLFYEEKALFKTLPERHHDLIPLNMEAVKAGKDIIDEVKA